MSKKVLSIIFLISAVFFILLFSVSKAEATISVTATSTIATQSNTNNWTWAHTNTGNLVAVTIIWWDNSGAVTLNSVTYGGQALTLGKHTDQPSYVYNADVWYKISNSLPTGSNNVVVNFSANSYGKASALSASGVLGLDKTGTLSTTNNFGQIDIVNDYANDLLVTAFVHDVNYGGYPICGSGAYLPDYPLFWKGSDGKASVYSIRTATYTGDVCANHDGGKIAMSLVSFSPGPVNSINITSPLNSATVADFSNFTTDLTFATTTYSYDACVHTSTSSSYWNCPLSVDSNTGCFGTEGYLLGSTSTVGWLVPKSGGNTLDTNYYSNACLYDLGHTLLLASSTQINFEIRSGVWINDVYYVTPPTATTTNEYLNYECDPNSGFWEASFCHMLVFLFVPSNTVLENFKINNELLFERPPFSYLGLFKSELENISITTTSAPVAGIDIDFGSGTTTFAFFDLSKASDIAGTAWISTWRTFLSYGLWFLMLGYIITRIRNLFSL